MKPAPTRLFLDTNIYIIGVAYPESPEAALLSWLGYGQEVNRETEVVISQELIEQILRVGKRLHGKDWGSAILSRLWNDLNLVYVTIPPEAYEQVRKDENIPREDIGVYLTALVGQSQCFVSSNHVLVKALVKLTGEFECLTPQEFIKIYSL